MKKIAAIYGTRPEAIKMAPLIAALKADNRFEVTVIVTGQHREMLDQVNSLFGITADHDLDISSPGQSLTSITTKVLEGLAPLLTSLAPDGVIVQGDTTSAFAGALAAFYQQIPVFHLEAGLRSGNIMNPFPEEANRKLISQIAALHFAPTAANREALLRDGVNPDDIVVTGNTVIDALLHTAQLPGDFTDPQLQQATEDANRQIVLVTTHRRENWGEPLQQIATAIAELAQLYPSTGFVVPMHKNPAVREVLQSTLAGLSNVHLLEPLDYAQFARLINRSHLILTDSGGVQEEAPSLGKPVLVLRETTERAEGVESGNVKLIGTNADRIVKEARLLLDVPAEYQRMTEAANPYGDGTAALQCTTALAQHFALKAL
ncbi:non-hydrolyzing UDP-N-acetylglucosamine 2-epimerase [Psychromicrobium lacuslunae]|uniref:UDP-N-acetylglucosamine 2-epimerase (non-hydrolyzing) n=1 Tax=Psychromicrobium lacuslunae TaxID=1618207 RepID=A0A0D4C1J7_9MICC|nr:UDP-N-acetylglucosamine 2-epimerase (non-hydrolyzing) [Psychromicrobium lacuslunae]AJT42226.1 UDP-N-acetylglucosamine 2-epimerase [Psychromicrobium lacuslunae]